MLFPYLGKQVGGEGVNFGSILAAIGIVVVIGGWLAWATSGGGASMPSLRANMTMTAEAAGIVSSTDEPLGIQNQTPFNYGLIPVETNTPKPTNSPAPTYTPSPTPTNTWRPTNTPDLTLWWHHREQLIISTATPIPGVIICTPDPLLDPCRAAYVSEDRYRGVLQAADVLPASHTPTPTFTASMTPDVEATVIRLMTMVITLTPTATATANLPGTAAYLSTVVGRFTPSPVPTRTPSVRDERFLSESGGGAARPGA